MIYFENQSVFTVYVTKYSYISQMQSFLWFRGYHTVSGISIARVCNQV